MTSNNPDRSKEQVNRAIEKEETLPLAAAHSPSTTGIIDNQDFWENDMPEPIEDQDTARVPAVGEPDIEGQDTSRVAAAGQANNELPTRPVVSAPAPRIAISRGKALIGILFLAIVVFNAISAGNAGFIGASGWAFVLGGSNSSNATNPIDAVKKKLQQHPAPGASATATPALTPAQYIDDIIQNMTLEQKLGQMMIVQFVGSTYLPDISAMINQYNVGAVLL
ncbi:MAG TPA: hypothetical protein VIZ18_11495, partial [Ktedonobacteraceae bacterium]